MALNLPGVSSRVVRIQERDLDVHILEVKPKTDGVSPLILLLHGFPEMAFSWRYLLVPLSEAGYHVVAPDQRGCGQTKQISAGPTMIQYEDDPTPFRMDNLVNDVVALVQALGYSSCAAIAGHDFASHLAGFCVLLRPKLFKSVVFMSAPFTSVFTLPGAARLIASSGGSENLLAALHARLSSHPTPKQHFSMYNASPEANLDMLQPPQGLRRFLREYFFARSGNHAIGPNPYPITSIDDLRQLPGYLIMDLHQTMPEETSRYAQEASAKQLPWLSPAELEFYVQEFRRTGFQPGLNMFRGVTGEMKMPVDVVASLLGKQIEIPALFIAGTRDWVAHYNPGAVDVMQTRLCARMHDGPIWLKGAGHWIQQERAEEVTKHLKEFLKKNEIG